MNMLRLFESCLLRWLAEFNNSERNILEPLSDENILAARIHMATVHSEGISSLALSPSFMTCPPRAEHKRPLSFLTYMRF
jgi:hypothetical protein